MNEIRVPYRFFIPMETAFYLNPYAQERQRQDEEVTDKSPLFRAYRKNQRDWLLRSPAHPPPSGYENNPTIGHQGRFIPSKPHIKTTGDPSLSSGHVTGI